jgi:hypothetical protein
MVKGYDAAEKSRINNVMTSTQQNSGSSGGDGIAALVGGVTSMSHKAQEIAREIAKLSQENVDLGANAAAKFRNAKTFQDVTTIQMDMMKAAYETMNAHSRKIAQLTAATPSELVKSYGDVVSALSKAGGEFTQKAMEMTVAMGEKASSAAQKMGEHVVDVAAQKAKATENVARG